MSGSDPWWKRSEIAIRRGVVRILSLLVRRSAQPPRPSDLPHASVLFIRQDRLGDVLVSTPLIAALSTAYPGMRLDMLVSRNNVAAVRTQTALRRSWVYGKTLGSMVLLVRAIRRERYDFAVDLMDNPSATSTLFCVLSGARWTVGLEKENSYAYDLKAPLRSRRDVHIVDRLGELLRIFGVDPASMPPRVVYTPSSESRGTARRTFEHLGIAPSVKGGINISAGSQARAWGVDQFRDLARRIVAEHPLLTVVVLAKPGDEVAAGKVAEGIPRTVVLPPTPSFDVFAAAIEHLDLLVTPDTSAVHLASAFNIPSVVLYVQSDPSLRVWEPRGTACETVVTATDDLGTITVDEVWQAWRRLVSKVGIPTSPRVASPGLRVL